MVMTLLFLLYGVIFGIDDALYVNAYNAIIANGETVLFAILAFWFIEASYYAFRARNLDMLAFLIPAFIVMVGKTPLIGAYWAGASSTVQWFLSYPMSSAYRGIIIAVAISVTLMAVRIILLQERGWMGAQG
jgi:predicted small integral membrane protein